MDMEEKKATAAPGADRDAGPAAEPVVSEASERQPEPGGRPHRRFPTPGDLFAMLGIVFGAQIVVGFAMRIVLLAVSGLGADGQTDPAAAGRMMAACYFVSMALALGGVLWYRHARGGAWTMGRFSLRGVRPLLLLWAFVLIAGLNIVLDPLVSLLPEPPYEQMGRGAWTVAMLVVMAPLFEELLCRGVVLEALRARYGVVAAWLFSSLFFGVLHVYPGQVIGTFAVGLVLGFIYIATDSLWTAMALHAINNAAAYALLAAGYADVDLADLLGGKGTLYGVVYVAALAVTAVSAWMVRKQLLRLNEAGKNPADA